MVKRRGSCWRVPYDSTQLYDESLPECLEFGNFSIRLKQAMTGNCCKDFDKSQELPRSDHTEGYYSLLEGHFELIVSAADCFEPSKLVESGFI